MREEPLVRILLRLAAAEIAGQEREVLIVVAPDGTVVLRREGSHNEVRLDDLPAEHLRGAYATHNHPAGTSFSIQDVRMMLFYRLAELRAVSDRYEYVFELPDDEWEDVEFLVQSVYERLENEAIVAVNTGELTPEENLATSLHKLWNVIAEIRDWRYRREVRG